MSNIVIAITSPYKKDVNPETKVIQDFLRSEGYSCILYDWNNVKSTLSMADVVIHRHVGSIRERYNQGFKSYLSEIRKIDNVSFVNNIESYEYGIKKEYLLDLQYRGFPTIPTVKVASTTSYERVMEVKEILSLGKAVMKPIDGELAQDVKLLSEIDRNLYNKVSKRTSSLLLQPFVEGIRNGERSLSIVMINGTLHIPYGIKRIPKDWIAKSSECEEIREFEPSEREKMITKNIFKSGVFDFLNNGFFRIDFVGEKSKLVNEVEIVNPEVGLNNLSKAKKEEYLSLFKKMIKNKHEKRRKRGG